MKVARLYGIRDIRVEDAPEPGEPGPGEARLRVTAVGICGSDLHYYREGGLGGVRVAAPFILGHEFAACVEAVGPSTEQKAEGRRQKAEGGEPDSLLPSAPH